MIIGILSFRNEGCRYWVFFKIYRFIVFKFFEEKGYVYIILGYKWISNKVNLYIVFEDKKD